MAESKTQISVTNIAILGAVLATIVFVNGECFGLTMIGVPAAVEDKKTNPPSNGVQATPDQKPPINSQTKPNNVLTPQTSKPRPSVPSKRWNYFFWLLGVLGTITTAVVGRVLGQFVLDWLKERKIRKKLQKDPYTINEIKVAAADHSRVYIYQDCQNNDPSGDTASVQRRSVFAELDHLLGPPLQARIIMILADSGMGKTALLSKYYAYHWSSTKRSAKFNLVVVPLNRQDADRIIGLVPMEKRNQTVLFLDSLDEDPLANIDCQRRLQDIAVLANQFHCVLVTSRTQFFSNEAAITISAPIPVIAGPVGLGETPPVSFKKIYLSPFSNIQMRQYLRKRFLLRFHPITFFHARTTAKQFADLISRPMLLTYIQDLVNEKRELRYIFEVYQIIVEQWLKREVTVKHLAKNSTELLGFSHKMAGELFANGLDRLSEHELKNMALSFTVVLDYMEIQQRSLLNRDDKGNWKFAHRSIMEYLLVRECFNFDMQPFWVSAVRPWTDQMKLFAREMSHSKKFEKFNGINIKGINPDFMATPFTGLELEGSFTCFNVEYNLRWIPPGKFDMGSPAEEQQRQTDEKLHEVILTKGFWLADTTVTQALWTKVTRRNPASYQVKDLPVENVSWDDCQEFIRLLNEIIPGLEVRLPSEAEWEYACRAGTRTPFLFGENITPDQVNYNGNCPYAKGRKGEYRKRYVSVKELPCNEWGLFQMHGNVWEWCQDWYGEYATGSVTDPQGPSSGMERVLRGGSWSCHASHCRSAMRWHSGGAKFRPGLRLARG